MEMEENIDPSQNLFDDDDDEFVDLVMYERPPPPDSPENVNIYDADICMPKIWKQLEKTIAALARFAWFRAKPS